MAAEPDPYCDLILAGKAPVDVVLEGHELLSFHHPSPSFAPVQVMIIPKRHILSLADLAVNETSLCEELLRTLAMLAARVEEEHGQARVVTNLGGLQRSRHMHWHIIAQAERVEPPEQPRNETERLWREYWRYREWVDSPRE
ncbi:HIT domain-containing protein [Candidatus Microthrix parvicella]|uniref:HIT domain-containing protein n=1 Tax=Candidatus Neomicrothrix parvicella TaxID=41950 RepID=UPI0009DB54DC